jgi:hypothetical protein
MLNMVNARDGLPGEASAENGTIDRKGVESTLSGTAMIPHQSEHGACNALYDHSYVA